MIGQNVKSTNVILMRDYEGNVIFEDFNEIHDIFHAFLNEDDWDYIRGKQAELAKEAKDAQLRG